jgi:hypothetical protein
MMRKFFENDETLTGVIISTDVGKDKKNTSDYYCSGNYDCYDHCCKDFLGGRCSTVMR